jgi:hypothetical protein
LEKTRRVVVFVEVVKKWPASLAGTQTKRIVGLKMLCWVSFFFFKEKKKKKMYRNFS